MALSPGTPLGSYEILATLGAGGMGEVYRARDKKLGRDVAIKAIPEAFARDPDRLARFRREAQLLAALNNPNIAAIYGLEEVGGVPYLVLELVEGETLATRLARGPLALPDALRLGAQVASAVEAAHERGIVHRDLKPGNVMLTPAGLAKVLDFGLATSDAPLVSHDADASTTVAAGGAVTQAGAIVGTVAYMSPEQVRGLPLDRRSDVWSFGCVLYECLTGRPAFGEGAPSEVMARVLEREPGWNALPASVPARVRDLLRRCLRKDADARPRDIRDVRLELTEAAAGGAKGAASQEKSIAVLPFENLSGPDDEYFADGVADEIMNALSHLDGLRVAARTSCFAFKGRREDLRAVGEKLDVGTVLEGTVRRAGSKLRITVQLVNAADGYQLWSERYDREMTDVFAIQDEIASSIAARLRGAMDADASRAVARHGTQNLEAYELFLRGRAHQGRRGQYLDRAIACFERAIELDPRYAEAMAWLADSFRLLGTFSGRLPSDVMPRARQLAERALSIDSSLTEAWATLASVEEQYDWDFPRSGALYARVLEMDPRHSRARAQRALWVLIRGESEPGPILAETEHAVQDDPLNAWVVAMHSFAFGIAGRHENSIAIAERSLGLDPDSFFARWSLMRSHAWAGHYDPALGSAPDLLRDSGRHSWVLGMLAWTQARRGRLDLARAVYDEMEGRSRHEFMSPVWLSVAADSAGLAEASLSWIERGVKDRDPLVFWGRRMPLWEGVRSHPRFEETIRPAWGKLAPPRDPAGPVPRRSP